MTNDRINAEYIEKLLKVKATLTIHGTTDSTNLDLKELAKAGAETGTVVIAENQKAGRGRLGRQFYSPSHSGIYMSLLIRPDEKTDTGLLTAYTAVAVCNALEEVSGEKFGIKWVNDILKDGKKVCGILAEAGVENGKTEYIIVGIGINVYPPNEGFPEEINNIAGSVFDSPADNARNEIIAKIINNFFSYSKGFIEEYKRKSVVLGKEISVHKRDSVKKALALDIDKNCNLFVKYENGETENLSFGEISVRV